jgi:hypothetical protein
VYVELLDSECTSLVRRFQATLAFLNNGADVQRVAQRGRLLHPLLGPKPGGWVVKLKTAKNPLKRAFAALSDWCRENLHLPIREQHRKLTEKLQGHYGYYGIIGNYFSLQQFLEGTRRIWKRSLNATPSNLFAFTMRKPLPCQNDLCLNQGGAPSTGVLGNTT